MNFKPGQQQRHAAAEVVKAQWWHSLGGARVQHNLHPKRCQGHDGQRTFGVMRQATDGDIMFSSYGLAVDYCVASVEKNIVHDVHPGSPMVSLAKPCCRLECCFCQNEDIDGAQRDPLASADASAIAVAAPSMELNYRRVASTYDEAAPTTRSPAGGAELLAVETVRSTERIWPSLATPTERIRILAELDEVLASVPTPQAALEKLAELVLGCLADFALVYTFDGKRIERVSCAHVDSGKARAVRSLDMAAPPSIGDSAGAGAVLRSRRAVMASGLSHQALTEGIRSEGLRRTVHRLEPVSSMTVPLEARGRVIGVITFASTKLSDRRYEQSDLEFAVELCRRAALAVDNCRMLADAQHAVRVRDEFAAILAHDLRGLLNTMAACCDVLSTVPSHQHPTRPQLSDQSSRQQRAIDTMLRAVTAMADLTSALLGVSQTESSALRLDKREVSTTDLLTEAHALAQPLAAARGVKLVLENGHAELPLLVDRVRILQALSNLLGNAIKHTPPGNAVVLAVNRSGGRIVVSVTDGGPGIPPADRGRIFDRFWHSLRTRTAGAGLGLAIARGVVEAHGGRIWLERSTEAGSVFAFSLPLPRRR